MTSLKNIDSTAVEARWARIRRNEACDLSLAPESVAAYLAKPESELVRDRILESLSQMAIYRIAQGTKGYRSSDPPNGGSLATCEGLETFLVPAVEEALPFSTFLTTAFASEKEQRLFLQSFKDDVNALLAQWKEGKGRFAGDPYAEDDKILMALLPTRQGMQPPDIVEAAAMACRVSIHLLTLKLAARGEEPFRALVGDSLSEQDLFAALKNGVNFLIAAFLKGEGADDDERIVNASVADIRGSGWSWTDWPGLPPMLFFTAAAVDAFAELDLYLIRPSEDPSWLREYPSRRQLVAFYVENKEIFVRLQLCVEMARLWVQDEKGILPVLSTGDGLHAEAGVVYPETPRELEPYEIERKREGLTETPTALYNSLYGLQILLWSWADWNDSGESQNVAAKSKINRALSQLVYNYDSVSVIKKVLTEFPYEMCLPGAGYFRPDTHEARRYIDSGFLPLLTRLLVLFVVYGVGDRNLLEPVIRALYVELLQSRHRRNPNYPALWTSEKIEVFSTQRAIQALTFYFAYARGKERVGAERGAAAASLGTGDLLFRNTTGLALVIEASTTTPVRAMEVEPSEQSRHAELPDIAKAENFRAYQRQISGYTVMPSVDPDVGMLQEEITDQANRLLSAIREQRIPDTVLANCLLYAYARLVQLPVKGGVVRKNDLKSLNVLAEGLIGSAAKGDA